jgi:tryptophan-rich hypothetical protein
MPASDIRHRLSPKKLLLSKWTAVAPRWKEKHFLVTKVVEPEIVAGRIELVELEAVYSKRVRVIPWRELQDSAKWQRGWVNAAATV